MHYLFNYVMHYTGISEVIMNNDKTTEEFLKEQLKRFKKIADVNPESDLPITEKKTTEKEIYKDILPEEEDNEKLKERIKRLNKEGDLNE